MDFLFVTITAITVSVTRYLRVLQQKTQFATSYDGCRSDVSAVRGGLYCRTDTASLFAKTT